MKISIDFDTANPADLQQLAAITNALNGGPCVAQPPQGLDIANSETRPEDLGTGTVAVYTAEGKEAEAVSNMSLDESVEKVEVDAQQALNDRKEEQTTTTKRKRRTKAEVAQDTANETGEPVKYEYRGKEQVAYPDGWSPDGGGEPKAADPLASVAPDGEGKEPTHVVTKDESGKVETKPVDPKPKEEALPEDADIPEVDAAIDEAVKEEKKEAPKVPAAAEGAIELKKLMVQLVKKHGASGPKITADIVKKFTGQTSITGVTEEHFADVFVALTEAVASDAPPPTEETSGGVNF